MEQEHRFATSILVEITVAWNQDLESFTASAGRRGDELMWEIGGHRHFPTIATFQAALRNKGVSLPAMEANRLITNQEAAQRAAQQALERAKNSAA
ncbi:hypothetical protein ABZ470_39865 [Streptosporangium sp. NPDC020072]|uniref:hypothetical protein n=1 Tax=Streptosporangium sp. NPDC020072 TaxID=3154788 RepID=UPI003424D514